MNYILLVVGGARSSACCSLHRTYALIRKTLGWRARRPTMFSYERPPFRMRAREARMKSCFPFVFGGGGTSGDRTENAEAVCLVPLIMHTRPGPGKMTTCTMQEMKHY